MKLLFIFLFLSDVMLGQTWLQLSDFPNTERDDGVAVTLNNKVYFGTGLLAGFTLGKDFYAYDLSANTWSTIAAMSTGNERQYACAWAFGNSFYVFSGAGYSNAVFTDLQRYDLATNTWTVLT
ncbi:MAG: kelch repeat-containing protein, partial [Bacteroidia bacterium]